MALPPFGGPAGPLPKHGSMSFRAIGVATSAHRVPRCRPKTGLELKGMAGQPGALLALGPGANRNAAAHVAARM